MSYAKEIGMLKSFAKTGNVNALKRLKLNWPEAKNFARHDRNIALRMATANGNANILEELRVNWGMMHET